MEKHAKVVVIGGGVVGLCSAYFLIKDGHNVTIIDKSNLGNHFRVTFKKIWFCVFTEGWA